MVLIWKVISFTSVSISLYRLQYLYFLNKKERALQPIKLYCHIMHGSYPERKYKFITKWCNPRLKVLPGNLEMCRYRSYVQFEYRITHRSKASNSLYERFKAALSGAFGYVPYGLPVISNYTCYAHWTLWGSREVCCMSSGRDDDAMNSALVPDQNLLLHVRSHQILKLEGRNNQLSLPSN